MFFVVAYVFLWGVLCFYFSLTFNCLAFCFNNTIFNYGIIFSSTDIPDVRLVA